MLCIREGSCSDLGPDTGYPDLALSYIYSAPPEEFRVTPHRSQRPLPSTYLPIRYSLKILSPTLLSLGYRQRT